MQAAISYSELREFISNNSALIDNVHITKVSRIGFNDMEGVEVQVNIKINTINGYCNKLIAWLTNSTYSEDYSSDESLNTALGLL